MIFTGFWGGDSASPSCVRDAFAPSPGDLMLCADGGYVLCASAGFRPDAVLGDFDSLSPSHRADIDAAGIVCAAYPAEKDDTDTLLCVKYGLEKGCTRFLLIGGIGGEFDHTMATVQTLSFLTDMECEAEIVTPDERLFMADGETLPIHREPRAALPVLFSGRPGAKFSVFSYAERSSGIRIENAKYELKDAVLTQSYPIGVRNEFINENPVTVFVRYGRLLIVCARQ